MYNTRVRRLSVAVGLTIASGIYFVLIKVTLKCEFWENV
jgi:hypothetical protein